VNLFAPVSLALLLASPRRMTALHVAVLIAAATCHATGKSRSGTFLFAAAMALTLIVSMVRRPTWHKARVAGGLVAFGATIFPFAFAGLLHRFDHARDSAWMSRVKLLDAATAMIEDHPFGVGANSYTFAMNNLGYAYGAGLHSFNKGLVVHNVYYLVAAETGWLGLLTFLLLKGTMLVGTARGARVPDVRGDVSMGLTIGLMTTLVHDWADYGWVVATPSVIIAAAMGWRRASC
jgi:O-antigen ligase